MPGDGHFRPIVEREVKEGTGRERMMCFSVQRLRKRLNGAEQTANVEESSSVNVEAGEASSPPSTVTAFSSARLNFRRRVRAIQNAQRFIYGNPKLRSSHPSYGSRDGNAKTVPDSSVPLLPHGGSARSASELNSSLFDVAAAYQPLHIDKTSSPRPLPSPRPTPQPVNAYPLPLPSETANITSLHPSSTQLVSPRLSSHMQTNTVLPSSSPTSTSAIFQPILHTTTSSTAAIPVTHVYNESGTGSEPELQPLPPLKVPMTAPALKCFSYNELASACQNFSSDLCFDDADNCFYGAIKVNVNEKVSKHQDVVIVRPQETQHQGLQDWMSKLLMVAHELLEQPHVGNLIGFCGEDGCSDRLLVYEKLRRGSLCTMLFDGPDASPLDWQMRIRIAYGAAQGLATVHEKFPDKVLYKDFRASSIQVDDDHSSKISGYRLVNTSNAETQTSQNNPRVHAYRAPETMSRGELSQKSNVWSFGMILLELLSGKQNMDERTKKDKGQNLMKWAKPFLTDEGKLFLLMDPKLHGQFPYRGAKMAADLAMLCLQQDPMKRPTMREVLDRVTIVQELKCTLGTSTKEPTSTHKFSSLSSTSLPRIGDFSVKPVVTNEQRLSYHRLPTKLDIIEPPPLRPLLLPPRCSEDIAHDYTPAPLARVKF